MSPRRHKRRLDAVPMDEFQARRGVEAVQAWRDDDWVVRGMPGAASGKAYRCPGCDQGIGPGVAHVVVWLVDGDVTDRRHWHSGCWRARDRRTPNLQRGRRNLP
jgi:hypothetical protein